MVFIKNSYTGAITADILGTKDELKYYRVSDAIKKEDSPQKKFYDNKTEFVLDKLFTMYPGKLEQYEASIRMNIKCFNDTALDRIQKNYRKKDIRPVLDCISNTPIVSFTEIISMPDSDFIRVGRSKY